ncbi:unnamed protein product, partial [Ectocarpus sp. 13 AM-2016]
MEKTNGGKRSQSGRLTPLHVMRRCSLKTRIRWATACIRWRLGGRRNTSR